MPWARLDDGFHDHPKVDGLSLAAVGLYTLCLTWAHRHRKSAPLPGHITEARVRKLAGKDAERLAAELLASTLWEPENDLGGYVIHDFADYLPKERDPEERAAAGRKGAASRWQGKGKPDGKLPSSDVANDGSRASAPAYPSRPDPTHEELPQGGERRETLRVVDATKPPTCTAHPDGNAPGPCNACRKVREWHERQDEKHNDRAKQAEIERAKRCPDCAGSGWREHPTTGLPAGKCDHRRAS